MHYIKIVCCLLFAVIAGCSPMHKQVPKYGLGVANSTDQRLVEVKVRWNETEVEFGIFRPGVDATYDFAPSAIADVVTVIWQTPDDKVHEKQVTMPQKIPQNFKGRVLFTIHENEMVSVELREL